MSVLTHSDWTVDPETNRSNSSPEFLRLSEEVGRLIRESASDIVGGRTYRLGVLIMAQLAHVHGLVPPPAATQEAER